MTGLWLSLAITFVIGFAVGRIWRLSADIRTLEGLQERVRRLRGLKGGKDRC